MPGRPRSLTSRSGDHDSVARSASAALATARTRAPAPSRASRNSVRVSGSSSTSRISRPFSTARCRQQPRVGMDARSGSRPSVAGRPADASGRRMVNVAPRPAPSLAAWMVPPCRSTSCLRDGQAETQAAVAAIEPRVGLPERLEDVGQELRRDARPAVGHADFDRLAVAPQRHPHAAAARRELDGVGQQVREHLQQARGVGGHDAGERIDFEFERQALGVGGRLDAVDAPRAARSRPESAPGSSRTLPAVMRDMSSRSSISWFCATAFRSMTSIARGRLSGGMALVCSIRA